MSKKKILGISSIAAVLIIIIFAVGFSGNKPPKNVDVKIYKETVKLMAYYERAEKSGLEVDSKRDFGCRDKIKEYLNDREPTEQERDILQEIMINGYCFIEYKKGNSQQAKDTYIKNKNKIKKNLGIPESKEFNSIKIE